MDADLILALQLQEEFNRDFNDENSRKEKPSYVANPSRELSIVDESWELTDPNPDIRALFLQYNEQFFWGKLAGVEVRWSPRMTLCAGICCYEGRGGLCSVRLSKPLLSLRPRKDLVETLLHEMIHALLFVTQNNKDHDGHGPEFQKHMNRINKQTGTNISIYHNFHDEVAHFKQHWWRCNGACQTRRPYFGYVKRSMNRAPSPRDFWWPDHQRTCGGEYTKVKEPEGYGEKKKGKTAASKDEGKDVKGAKPVKSGSLDIRQFTGGGVKLGSGSSVKGNNFTQSGRKGWIDSAKKEPTATVSRPVEGFEEPALPDLNLSLSRRIAGINSGRPPSSSVSSNNIHSKNNINLKNNAIIKSGVKEERTSEQKKLVLIGGILRSPPKTNGESPSKNVSKSSDQKTKYPTKQNKKSPLKQNSKSPEKQNSKSPVKQNSKSPVKSFHGAGHTLGSSSGGGKGVLAMLRKQWERERSKARIQNVDLSEPKTTSGYDSLDLPSISVRHRKRNSDEFGLNADCDLKKVKIENDTTKGATYSRISGDGAHSRTDGARSGTSGVSGFSSHQSVGDLIVLGETESESKSLQACPVCQTRVELSLINEHLDRCLIE